MTDAASKTEMESLEAFGERARAWIDREPPRRG